MARATAMATAAERRLPPPVSRHITPIIIMEKPMVFRMSTRSRSVHGDQG
jgi:hypothetical protein